MAKLGKIYKLAKIIKFVNMALLYKNGKNWYKILRCGNQQGGKNRCISHLDCMIDGTWASFE